MNYLGLLFEVLLFGLGLYVYLLSRGAITFKNSESAKKAEEFRLANKTWMRLTSIALMALMAFEIYLHITSP